MKKQNKTVKEIFTKIATEAIEAKLKTTRVDISKNIDSALLSIIGLEKRNYSDQMEIDHCNGRNSVLIDAFRRIATEEAEKLARTYKPTKEDIAGFREAFAKEYRNTISYSIREHARNRAIKDMADYFTENELGVDKIIEEVLNN